MSRPREQTESINSDSFLDIVASVVSIMIIMVVMEGTRIKNAPVTAALADKSLTSELETDRSEESLMRDDVLKASENIEHLQMEASARGLQRDMLATAVADMEHKIEEHRQKLDSQQRENFDLARSLSEARLQLDRLNQKTTEAEAAEAPPVIVENYPTPISRMVDSDESHFQLSGGSIIRVPMQELMEQFQADARRKVYKLQSLQEITETLGPVDGFRLKYTLERHDMTPEEAKETHRMGSVVHLKRWILIPVANPLGEPVEVALNDGSAFRQALLKLKPGRHTVTIWTYDDSFDAFRQIRKELYRLGFSLAVRPMPQGQPICGSPEGSKSSAQ
jgi:hypothetical protein